MILPKGKPVYGNLSSEYVDVPALIQHCQLEFGSGCIHFISPEMEGVIFFQRDKPLNGFLQNRENKMSGEKIIPSIFEALKNHHCNISIYKIDLEKVRFWMNLYTAEEVHKNLNAKFVDLEGFLKKMESEKFSGYIDIHIGGDDGRAIIFYESGRLIEGSYSWAEGEANNLPKNQQILLEKVKKGGGIFHVNRITLPFEKDEGQTKESDHKISPHTITMLEELLNLLETLVNKNKKTMGRFDFLLKNKFIEKLDRYPFLNPFLDTLEYSDKRLLFKGDAKEEEFVQGIVISVKELAEDLNLLERLTPQFIQWAQKYQKDPADFGIIS